MTLIDQEKRAEQEIKVSDLKGDLHFHLAPEGQMVGEFTGSHDSEMNGEAFMEWARQYLPGFSYFVVTDHLERFDRDPGRFHLDDKYGIEHLYDDPELIEPQLARLRNLNEFGQGIQAIAGVEASIQRSGQVNGSRRVLSLFDVVVASDHYYQNGGNPEQVTFRYLTALTNPRVDILGHPGRNYADWDKVDWHDIAQLAAVMNKAIEINMTPSIEHGLKNKPNEPSRQLDFLKTLAKHHLKVSIGGDTHRFVPLQQGSPVSFHQLRDLARLVKDLNDLGFQKSQILNTYSAEELVKWASGNDLP